MRKVLPLMSLTAVPLAVSCTGEKRAEAVQRPNVVLIYADDVGFGDLSCNGEKTIATPNVDRLAGEGIRFTNAHSTAATSTPSRYSLLTGEYAWRREGTGIAAGNAAMLIRPERYTLADMFRDRGYKTGVVGKWHLGLGDVTGEQDWNGTVSPNPADLGFDYSYIMAATADRTPCVFMENGRALGLDPNDPIEVSYTDNFPGEPTGKDNPELLKMHPTHRHDQSIVNGISRIGYMKGGRSALWKDEDIADSITVHGVRFLEEQVVGEPFFLYFATNDIHVPRAPHPRFQGKSGMGPRGDAILAFDWSVGEILDALERLGLAENTIVILSSDNGPVVDDGYADRAVELLGEHRPWGPYRGGKYSIYEAGTRVPCIVRWPGVVAAAVSDELMCQVDWFRSLGRMLGAELPAGAAPDSEDHLDAWLDADRHGRDLLVVQNLQNNLALLTPQWKYIPAGEGPAINEETATELGNFAYPQLYNLLEDEGERRNYAVGASEVPEGLDIELDGELERIKDGRVGL